MVCESGGKADLLWDYFDIAQSRVPIKVYRLGGETDSAIRWRKRTACDVSERPEEAGC